MHVDIVYYIKTVQIPSLDLSHLTFLYAFKCVALLKHVFDLTLHYNTLFLQEMHFVVVIVSYISLFCKSAQKQTTQLYIVLHVQQDRAMDKLVT